jgi:hypothetical protein
VFSASFLDAHAELPAWATLAMWDRFRADAEQSLQLYAAPPARNLGEVGLPRFEFQIERHFSRDLDFGWFKQSVHGVLEAELERFGAAMGAKDLGTRRRPMELGRAFECLALRVCKGLKPEQIRSRPEFSRDWTTLWKDLKSAAELVGIRPPRRGRPSKKSAR